MFGKPLRYLSAKKIHMKLKEKGLFLLFFSEMLFLALRSVETTPKKNTVKIPVENS